MNFAVIPMWTVTCASCGEQHGDEVVGWETRASAEEASVEAGWKGVGKVRLCPDCQRSGGVVRDVASVQRVQFYNAKCDGCGEEHDAGDFSCWSDQIGAAETAIGSDWSRQDDNRLLCWNCRHEPGGDRYEAESEEVSA